MTTPLPNPVCPLCSGPNRCVPADRLDFDGPCWCERVSFAPALLARIPPDRRGTACICARCATAAT